MTNHLKELKLESTPLGPKTKTTMSVVVSSIVVASIATGMWISVKYDLASLKDSVKSYQQDLKDHAKDDWNKRDMIVWSKDLTNAPDVERSWQMTHF